MLSINSHKISKKQSMLYVIWCINTHKITFKQIIKKMFLKKLIKKAIIINNNIKT